MAYILRALSGPLAGSGFPLTSRLVIGRGSDVDVQLLESGVSRQHAAVLVNDAGAPFLMDLASANGTFLDDRSIGREPLAVGARFRIATSDFALEPEVKTAPVSMSAELATLHLLSGPAEDETVVELERPPIGPRR